MGYFLIEDEPALTMSGLKVMVIAASKLFCDEFGYGDAGDLLVVTVNHTKRMIRINDDTETRYYSFDALI